MSKRDGIKLGAAAVTIGVVLYFIFWQRAPNVAQIGGYSPDFTLPTLARGAASPPFIHLSEHRGHVVLVNFWASWCPPCVEETPSLEKFTTDMQKQGVEVIGVSVDQDSAALNKFVTDHHVSFTIARDPNQIVASRFGTSQFPETYILDRDGRVAEKIIGAIDWENPSMISFIENLAHPTKLSS